MSQAKPSNLEKWRKKLDFWTFNVYKICKRVPQSGLGVSRAEHTTIYVKCVSVDAVH